MQKTVFMLILGFSLNGQADELGRLFLTPQQRQQLMRTEKGSEIESTPAYLHVNGFMRNRHGRKMIWINQHTLQQAFILPGIQVQPYITQRNQVPVEATGQRFLLKPGQRLVLETLQIKDVFQPPKQSPDDASTEHSATPGNAPDGGKTMEVRELLSKYGPVVNALNNKP